MTGGAKRHRDLDAKLVAALLGVPRPERDAIADEVGRVRLHVTGGGSCIMRAVLGEKAVKRRLGVDVGGMFCRAGRDPARDVVAFSGRDDRLAVLGGGRRLLAHYRLRAGVVIDFSPHDWMAQDEGQCRISRHFQAMIPDGESINGQTHNISYCRGTLA